MKEEELIKMADDFLESKEYFIGKEYSYNDEVVTVVDVKRDPRYPDLEDVFLIELSNKDILMSYEFIDMILSNEIISK